MHWFERRLCLAFPLALFLTSCDTTEVTTPESSGSLVHLAERLEGADLKSAAAPEGQERRWANDDLRSAWWPVGSERAPQLARIEIEPLDDAVRLSLMEPFRVGGLATDLEDLRFADWDTVLVEARTEDRFAGISVAWNLDEEDAIASVMSFIDSPQAPPLFNDGSVQTYAIPLRPLEEKGFEPPETLHNLAVLFAAPDMARVDVLSVRLVPRGSDFRENAGVRPVYRAGTTRETVYAHAPTALTFPVEAPVSSRLDFALAVNLEEKITYRIRTGKGDHSEILFEETIDDPTRWHQRSVDLDKHAGSVSLTLEATSNQAGAVALWGAPILSGPSMAMAAGRPNVIFYVIDGGDANLMSLYGYDRPTTPFLEELAQEGVLFTRSYSNSTWTQPSTVSFMTSLQHSVLGGLRRGLHSTAVPTAAVPMAEHFRRAGYQTASFTANPNAGRLIGMERAVDFLRDVETAHHSTSSLELHERFWRFREAYPGGPTWVHFQTTDVHEPNVPEKPYAGRFVSAEERAQVEAWIGQVYRTMGNEFGSTSIVDFFDRALERAGIDHQAYYSAHQGLYDETMLHQDHALRELVATLKERGEWESTVLVIAADHGHPAGTFTRFGRGLLDPQPEPWQGGLFDAYQTRVPLLVIWPDHIEGGRRIEEPVSMIDVLPTLLDLVGLPPPEVFQGQSLVPLLRGEEMALRPVILDEFRVDEETGEMIGNLEIIDGKWGASLEIAPLAAGADPRRGRHATPVGGRWGAVHPYFPDVPNLLLYDLEADPFATRAVNDEHPELVERYRRQLLEQWQAHQALAGQFTAIGGTPLSPEQLQQLRALGYIQ